MKITLRVLALILAAFMLFLGLETLMPQFPSMMNNSDAIVLIFIGLCFTFYGVTGRSKLVRKSRTQSKKQHK